MYILPLLLSNLFQENLDNPFNFPILAPPTDLINFDHGVLDFYKGKNLLNCEHFVNTSIDNDTFKITMNVQQYNPEEITVKVVNRYVVVEAKHEAKQDENVVKRQFVRRFLLPNRADVDQVTSTISSDGILTITAPLIAENERMINIERTEQAAVSSNSQHNQAGTSETTTVSSNNQNSQAGASETTVSSNSQNSQAGASETTVSNSQAAASETADSLKSQQAGASSEKN